MGGWGGRAALDKNFFSGLNMYQAKSGVKNFSLYFGGGQGGPLQNFFFQSEHVSSQIWCQKFFPLLWGGRPLTKNFFRSEHVSSQIWCQKFFPLLWGGRGSPSQTFFFQSEHVSSQIWCQIFFPLLWGGGGAGQPLTKKFFSV